MLCFLPNPCSVATPASSRNLLTLQASLHWNEQTPLRWCHVYCVRVKIISFEFFFLSFLLPLSPGTIKFTSSQILVLAFFWSVVCINQTVASLEVHTVKDSVVLISDSYSCTSTKNLFAIFLYAHVVISVQISAIVMLIGRTDIDDQYTENGTRHVLLQPFVKLDTVKAAHCPQIHWLVLHHSSFYAFGYLVSITFQIGQKNFIRMLRNFLCLAVFLSFPLLWLMLGCVLSTEKRGHMFFTALSPLLFWGWNNKGVFSHASECLTFGVKLRFEAVAKRVTRFTYAVFLSRNDL